MLSKEVVIVSMAAQHRTGSGKHTLRNAWIWVISIPVAIGAAFVVGEGLFSALGYELGTDTAVPLWVKLVAGVPAVLIVLVPSYVAYRTGMTARRQGDERGLWPAIIGATLGVGFVLVNLPGLFFGP